MGVVIQNKEGKRNGVIVTLLVHALILLICIFFGFTYYTPPKGDIAIGFEALGLPDAGNSDLLATSEETAPVPQEASEPVTASAPTPVEKSYATQENSPVNVNSTQPVKQEKTAEEIEKERKEKEEREKKAKLDQRLSALKGPNQAGGKGDGGNDGNQGSPDGQAGGNGGSGGPGPGGNGGNGMFDFGGRKARVPGNLKHDCGEQGSVKLRLKVDRNGKVLDAIVVSGGTSFNQCLINKAIAAAKSTQYNSNPSGPEFQEGIITLKFKLN